MRKVSSHILTLTSIVLISIVTFINLFCNQQTINQTPEETYLNHNDTVKYVGINSCKNCHYDIYKTFIETGMGQSFNIASKQKSVANFKSHQVVYDKFNDMHYYPFWKNDSMYIMEYRLDKKDTTYKRIERVDYIVGSGQHTNSHMMNSNGYIYQMPLTWYAQKKQWDLPPGFENGQNSRFNRAIGIECMSCHNAMPQFDTTSNNKFITIPRGIDCERCHGPGELHVKEKSAGVLIDTSKNIDYTIVNPKKLSFELQIDVCQRCHLQGNAIVKEGKQFTDFKPGKKLSDYIDVYMPKYEGREDEFIMASHAQRLQMSNCFGSNQHTSKLTCITCHNPHVSVKVTGTQVFNNSCNSCHTTQQNNYCTEKKELLQTAKYNCVKCHMPKSGTIDIPHVSVTDHWIRVPAKKEAKEDIKKFVGIYCINNQESDALTRANAYLNYIEKFGGKSSNFDSVTFYLTQSTGNTNNTQIHLWYLQNEFGKIRKTALSLTIEEQTNGWLCYRIGRAFVLNNNFDIAKKWYNKAVYIMPNNLDFINALGGVLINLNEIESAKQILQSSIAKNPKQTEPLTNLGFLYAKQNDFIQAINYYNQALKLDPDYEQALLNKAAALIAINNRNEAKNVILHLSKKHPNNPTVKQLIQFLN